MKPLVPLLLLAFAAPLDFARGRQDPAPPARPRAVQRLVADGKHNAFTALVRWKDRYWLAFRAGASHNSQDGDITLLRSTDGENWTQVLRLDILADDRDPELLAAGGRLFLYVPSMSGAKLTSFVLFTDDGEGWSKPRQVYEPQFVFWKPLLRGDRFWATAHRKVEGKEGGKEREAHLITSRDGLAWEKVSTIRAGNWESETSLGFGPDGRLTAFLRTKYSVPGHILESDPPYTTWKQRDAGVHLSGHSLADFRGTTYLFSRTMDASGKKTGTMIYTYDGGALRPYCALPSGGDCSYPGAVEIGDEMLVSYYSSHEEGTNIYLARVPLRNP